MEMPRPGAEHERLSKLAGDWVGEEKISPSSFDPTGGSAVARFRARMGLDGHFLIADYEQERGGQVTYRGHGIFGFDRASGDYTMHWFDVFGMPLVPVARGPWEQNTLRLTHETPMGHSRYCYVLGDEGFRLRIENSPDGHAWAPFVDGRFRKK